MELFVSQRGEYFLQAPPTMNVDGDVVNILSYGRSRFRFHSWGGTSIMSPGLSIYKQSVVFPRQILGKCSQYAGRPL